MTEMITIETKADNERAEIRIAELVDAPEHSPEEAELVTLLLAMAIWKAKPKPSRWPTD